MHVEHTPGSPQWPMTESDRAEKFLDCAARVLGSRDAATVLELAQRCDQLPDIRQLLNATVPTQSKTDKSRARQPVS